MNVVGLSSRLLREVEADIISMDVCTRPDWYGRHPEIDMHGMICAGFEKGGKAICYGDSGGPLQCRGADGIWKLVGVVSLGDDGDRTCAKPKKPGLYSKIAAYLDWIKKYVKRA